MTVGAIDLVARAASEEGSSAINEQRVRSRAGWQPGVGERSGSHRPPANRSGTSAQQWGGGTMLSHQARIGRLSRRELLRRGAIGLGLVALDTACAPAASPPVAAPADSKPAAPAPAGAPAGAPAAPAAAPAAKAGGAAPSG